MTRDLSPTFVARARPFVVVAIATSLQGAQQAACVDVPPFGDAADRSV